MEINLQMPCFWEEDRLFEHYKSLDKFLAMYAFDGTHYVKSKDTVDWWGCAFVFTIHENQLSQFLQGLLKVLEDGTKDSGYSKPRFIISKFESDILMLRVDDNYPEE